MVPAELNVRLFATELAAPPHDQAPVPFIIMVVVPDRAKFPTVRFPPTLKLNAPFITAAPVVVKFPVTAVAFDIVNVKEPIERFPRVGIYAPEKVVAPPTVNVPVQFRALERVRVDVPVTIMLFQDNVPVLSGVVAEILSVEPEVFIVPAVYVKVPVL
jgi:hypothetical protein